MPTFRDVMTDPTLTRRKPDAPPRTRDPREAPVRRPRRRADEDFERFLREQHRLLRKKPPKIHATTAFAA